MPIRISNILGSVLDDWRLIQEHEDESIIELKLRDPVCDEIYLVEVAASKEMLICEEWKTN